MGSTLLVAALIVAAIVVDVLRLPVHTLSVAPAALLLTAPILVVSWRQRRGWPFRIDWQTDLMLLCVGAAVAWRLFSPAWPDLLPIGYSVDAVHHTALANYIFEQRQLVRDPPVVSAHLGEMIDYPPGFHVVTALLAQSLGVLPVQVIYPLAALAVVFGVLAVALLVAQSVSPRLRLLAGLAPLALLLMPDYILGAVARESYYPQVMAQWLIAAVGVVAVRQTRRATAGSWGQLALLLLALAFTYTTWLPVALLLVFLSLFAQREPWRRRLLYGGAVLLPIGGIALAYGAAHGATGISVAQHEGTTIRDPLGAMGIWLPCLALGGCALGWRTRQRWVCLALIAAAALHCAGLWWLWQQGRIAGYIYFKSYYLLALLLGVPVGWLLADAVGAIVGRGRAARRVLAPVAAVLLLSSAAVVGRASGMPALSPPEDPLSPGALEAAHWIRAHGTPDDVAFALEATGLSAYWLHVGVLSQPRTAAAHALLTDSQLGFWEWYLQPSMPRTLLLEQSAPLPTEAGLRVRFRNQCCMVLEKTAAAGYEAALRRFRPLVVNYRVAPFDILQHIDVRVFDQANQPDLHLRLVLQDGERALAAYTLDVPYQSGSEQRLEFVVEPHTLEATGYVENGPEIKWPAPETSVPPSYRALLQWLHRDTVVAERVLGQCCEGTGHWAVPHPSGKWIWFVPPVARTALEPQVLTLGDTIKLEGSQIEQKVTRPGEQVTLRLRWYSTARIDRRLITFVQLVAPDGGAAFSVEGEPNGGVTPTWRWQAGDRIDDVWQVKLPPDFPPGTYPVVVGMYDPATGRRLEAWRRQPYLERFWTDALPLGTIEVRR